MLDPWEGLVYNALVTAFGIGVWRSAQGSRALRAIGGLWVDDLDFTIDRHVRAVLSTTGG